MLLPQWRWLELVFWPGLVLLSAVVWLELGSQWCGGVARQLEAHAACGHNGGMHMPHGGVPHACQMEAQAVDVAASGRW